MSVSSICSWLQMPCRSQFARSWLEMRSIDTGWWAGEAQADFDVGAGDFAEAVAAYLLGSPTRSPHGPYSDAQLAFVADLISNG